MNNPSKLPPTLLLLVLALVAPAHAQQEASHANLSGRTHAEVLADYLTALPNVARVESHSEIGWAPRTRAEVLADYDKVLPAAKPNQSSLSMRVPHIRTPTQILADLDKA